MIVIADKFLNKYRIPSARASWWNYADSGLYFITICTVRHEHMFGKIKNQEMCLSPMGDIVQQEWDKSFKIRTQLFCEIVVIMPNHIHAILRILNGADTVSTHGTVRPDGNVETHSCASLQLSANKNYGVAYRPPKSISSFIAGFKSAATKRINEFRGTPKTPVWQTRFHDHIICNEIEYRRIYKYIKNNPANWKLDRFLK